MSKSVTILDETISGEKIRTFTLDNLTETMTLRELLRARIYQEVKDYNQKQTGDFVGLVQPRGAEKILNSFRFKKPKLIDWEDQFKQACVGFESNGFFVLVDDKQAESLEDEFEIKVDTRISFVKLVPLVGG